MNRRTVALTLAAAAALWLIVSWPQSGRSARSSTEAGTLSPVATVAPAKPKAEAAHPTPPQAQAPQAAAEAAAPAAAPGDVAQYLAWERAQFTSYFARLDAARAKEPRDAELATAVDQLAKRTMAEVPALSGSRLVSIECGTTLCRIEAHHDDELAKVQFNQVFPMKMGTLLAEGSLQTEPGSKVSVVQFARGEGQLPRFTELFDSQLAAAESEHE